MLDPETKQRIDNARNILVGKIPNPQAQVEQITIALIYKFMFDMDAEALTLSGKSSFFTEEFAKYSWNNLLSKSLGGTDLITLYSDAIQSMTQNPKIPALFRDIFKNAFLPYRDPETLRSFLKIINEFTYDHSERLGDAFEYLLSVLGSQGDAGQFRTPRHIIDFMVEIIDPKKNESILDPACGTAGFLISAYKHIIKHNSSAFKPEAEEDALTQHVSSAFEATSTSLLKYKGDKLTPAEKKRLTQNIKGYDISPDMVRLSLVNLYLHGFLDPKISEYDTLTSDDKWNDYFDIILANPPFMSPTGGIRPHKRFSIPANRSEVLFVDYIAEHLTTNGRAAIIVPEGIIFQSGKAYKALRKMLVENSLLAVISLPAGVFNPYSGVKTSILILDKVLAKKTENILFVKVENDGFDLGAQRRANGNSELPTIVKIIKEYIYSIKNKTRFLPDVSVNFEITAKEKIIKGGEYNLSSERYKENIKISSSYPLVKIEDVCIIERGASPRPIDDFITKDENGINWIKIGDGSSSSMFISSTKEKITEEGAKKSKFVKKGDFILSNSMSFGHPYILGIDGCIHDGWLLLRPKEGFFLKEYLYYVLSSERIFNQFTDLATGGVVNNLNSKLVRQVQIPLPPLEAQKEIVAEIEGYQKIIDGARMVVENYKPKIEINPEWPLEPIGSICEVINGRAYKQDELLTEGKYPVLRVGNFFSNRGWYFSNLELPHDKYCNKGDLLYAWSASFGPKIWDGEKAIYHYHIWKIIPNETKVNKQYLFFILGIDTENIKTEGGRGIAMIHITKEGFEKRLFPIPPLNIQETIVSQLVDEKHQIDTCNNIIKTYTQKIKDRIAAVWNG